VAHIWSRAQLVCRQSDLRRRSAGEAFGPALGRKFGVLRVGEVLERQLVVPVF
jgi:hypothetical protein